MDSDKETYTTFVIKTENVEETESEKENENEKDNFKQRKTKPQQFEKIIAFVRGEVKRT